MDISGLLQRFILIYKEFFFFKDNGVYMQILNLGA